MVDAPVNLTYGTVTGKYFLSVLDSVDADRYPDYIAATGTVTFTPSVRSYKNLSIPATFATNAITCTVDSFGDLRDPSGALGVVLVASDNAAMQPRDWTYNVQVNVGGSVESFPLLVTGGSVIDLTIVGPATSSAGTAVVVSSADRVLAQAAAAAAAQSAIDAASASGGLDVEAAQDMVGAMTSATGYASVTYNDGAGTLVIGTTTALQTALDGKAATGHTHTSAQVSDFTEAVQDVVGAFMASGTGATVTYNDAANTITIAATGTSDLEAIRDAIGVALIGVGVISVTVDDAANTITISSSATANSTDAALRDRTTHTGVQAQSTVTNLTTDLAARSLKTATPGVRVKSGSTDSGAGPGWPVRPTGYPVVIAIGVDPSPTDSVAGDVRMIPAS